MDLLIIRYRLLVIIIEINQQFCYYHVRIHENANILMHSCTV